jgi:two-component system, chemotaxis family, protein-glutamate methylesterase/glutaminase
LRDIIVIGGSGGSFDALRSIVENLPAKFPVAIFVVIHLSPEFPSSLDAQISRWGNVPASQPSDQDPVAPGHIYVARPDRHMTLEAGRIRILRGPRENRHRPAIDPLFRTAARAYGERVIGVILSGLLDDGSAGLFAVKERGGIAVVQDPECTGWSEMPRRAIEYARPHYVLPTRDIAPLLVRLAMSDPQETDMAKPSRMSTESKGAESDPLSGPEENLEASNPQGGEGIPSVFACPECHGVLWELRDKKLVRFRCRVGHSYGAGSLAKELSAGAETALWAAMRALEEKAAMQRRLADGLGTNRSVKRLRDQSDADDANARVIRAMIFERDESLAPDEAGEPPARKTA